MSTNAKEAALEACIERHLTGGESVMPSEGGPMSDDVGVYQTTKGAGYLRGKSSDFKPGSPSMKRSSGSFLKRRRQRNSRSFITSQTGSGRFWNACTAS